MYLTKSENSAIDILIVGIDAPGRQPGQERPWLFETLRPQPPRELRREEHFLISFARNPLKSPDWEK